MDVNKPLKSGLSSAKRFSQRHASALLTKHGRPLARLPCTNLCQTKPTRICVQQEQASAIADQAAGQQRSQPKVWRIDKAWEITLGREKLYESNAQIERHEHQMLEIS